MKKTHWITVIFLISCWHFLALNIANDILLPLPISVIERMFTDVNSWNFFHILFHTLARTLNGLLIALGLALILGVGAGLNKTIKEILAPLISISKTIPNISYIFIVLIWLGREASVTVITFLILFPVLYATVFLAMNQVDPELKDVLRLYPENFRFTLQKLYLPHMLPYLFSGIKTTFGLGFKVSVMAEILGQVQIGIGKQLYLCRINLDMVGIFAWTIWIIVLCITIEALFTYFSNRLKVS